MTRAPRSEGKQARSLAKTHLRLKDLGYACGVGRRWMSQTISSTAKPRNVTCGGCRKTFWWQEALAKETQKGGAK